MVRFSIRRPVTVAMAYLATALLGVLAWRNLPIELLPDAELPKLTVRAQWTGASPETVEAFLTSPLEAAIQQVRGVENITSTSMEELNRGVAQINIEFERNTDMEFARLELSERLAALEEDLPDGVMGPYVEQYVPQEFDRQRQVFLRYTVTGPYTLEALRAWVDDQLGPRLREIQGVADVQAWGGRKRLLELELDEGKIRALGLNVSRVIQVVNQLEYVQEAGAIAEGGMLFPIALRMRADSIPQILATPVLSDKGRIVRISDVATIHDTFEDPNSYYRIDGRPAVSFQVVKGVRTNAVDVADRVKARLEQLESQMLPGMRLILDQDQSQGIRTQLNDVSARALVSAAIVFAVLLLFLRSFRSAAITFATIAFSILITVNLMYFGGFTLNVLTLMGLAMGFGIMIDNAIVVLENIYRKRRLGDEATIAAERGTAEVLVPILAATITNVIVLLPFIYLQGELRVFYIPLAVVVGFSQIASLIVGFTFIPALAARLLNSRKLVWMGAGNRGIAEQPWYTSGYVVLIRSTLRHPWVTVVLALLILGGSYYGFKRNVSTGVLWRPWFQEQTYIDLTIRQQRGEELERTDELARYFESRLTQVPYIERFVTNVDPLTARIRVTFPDSIANTEAPVVLKEQLTEYAVIFGGATVSVYGYGPAFSGTGGGGGSNPNYSIKILGYNYEKVRDIAEDLATRLKRYSRVREVDTNSAGRWNSDRASEIVLAIDRSRLALHGLSVQDLITQVNAAVAGRSRNSTLRVGGEEVLYSVKLEGSRYLDVVQLKDLLLPVPSGEMVRLGEVAELHERRILGRIIRENQQYQRLVSYEFRGPTKLGDRVKASVLNSTQLPPGFSIAEADSYFWSAQEKQQIYGVIGFGIILIFMISAMLFESLRQPLCILLTVPMALIGVFLLFWITRASFTREAYIGVIMMSGLVVNSSILLIDHVNQLRRKHGMPLHDALVLGATERVRPILMTTATTVLGLLPLVLFSEAADSNIWNALGFALIGGLTSSTVLVLTVTPALYLLFERRAERRRLAPAEPDSAQPVLVGAD